VGSRGGGAISVALPLPLSCLDCSGVSGSSVCSALNCIAAHEDTGDEMSIAASEGEIETPPLTLTLLNATPPSTLSMSTSSVRSTCTRCLVVDADRDFELLEDAFRELFLDLCWFGEVGRGRISSKNRFFLNGEFLLRRAGALCGNVWLLLFGHIMVSIRRDQLESSCNYSQDAHSTGSEYPKRPFSGGSNEVVDRSL